MSMIILKTQKTQKQSNLVKMLLASSVLLSAVSVVGNVQATTTVAGDINAAGFDDYNFTANVTLTVPNNININKTGGGASVTTDNNLEGTVTFQGNSTVLGNIPDGNSIKALNFEGGPGTLVTLNGTVDFADSLNFKNGGAVVFNDTVGVFNTNNLNAEGNGSVIFNKNITLDSATIVNVVGDTFTATFNGDVTVLNNVTLNQNSILNLQTGKIGNTLNMNGANSRVNFNDNYTITNNLNFAGTETAHIASNKTVTIGNNLNATAAPGAQLSFDLGNTDIPGKFIVVNDANIDANTVVNVTNANLNLYTVGTPSSKLLVQDRNGGAIAAKPILNAPNNLFIKFDTDIVSIPGDLRLVVTRSAPTGQDDNIQGLATALSGVTNTTAAGQPELLALLDNLGDFSDVEAQKEALASIAPLIDGGLTSTVLNTQETTFDLFSQRLSELRAGLDTYRTGYAAGSMDERGYGTWVKIFGSHADQDKRDSVQGYEAETWGLALGADMKVSDSNLVGIAFSWASTHVNHDLTSSGTDMDSYQGALYGSWNIKGPLYFNWMGSVAKNEYDSTRHTIVNNFRQTTVADFEGSQYGARGELGYVYGCKDFYITPILSLSYAHLDFDDYREEGNSTTNQFVSYKDVEALLAGAGVEFAYEYEWYQATMRPEVHANISYDLMGDKQEASAQFVSFGGAYETIGASSARTDYNVGLSLTTYGEFGLGMSISYDYNWKSDYHVHAGFVRVRYEW